MTDVEEDSTGLRDTLRRIRAFLAGDQTTAENFPSHDNIPSEQWIKASSGNADDAEYALNLTKRASDAIDSAVTSLEGKATSLTNLVMPLVPVAIAALGLATVDWPNAWAIVTTLLYATVVILLIGAAIRGYLASGARLVGAVNPRRLSSRATRASRMVGEADAWLFASEIGLKVIERRNRDLFSARRAVAWAFVVGALATLTFGIARASEEGATDPEDDGRSTVTISLRHPIKLMFDGWSILVVPDPRKVTDSES